MAFMISGMSKLLISAAYQGSLVTPYRWLDWNSWWNIETDAAVILPSEELFPGQNWKGQRRGNGSSSICFDSSEPRIQLYFLLGLVYAAVTLFLLPFILVFFLGSHMLSSATRYGSALESLLIVKPTGGIQMILNKLSDLSLICLCY